MRTITAQDLVQDAATALMTRRTAALHLLALDRLKAHCKDLDIRGARVGMGLWAATRASKNVCTVPAEVAAKVKDLEGQIAKLEKPHTVRSSDGAYRGNLRLWLPQRLAKLGGDWFAACECSDEDLAASTARYEAAGITFVRLP